MHIYYIKLRSVVSYCLDDFSLYVYRSLLSYHFQQFLWLWYLIICKIYNFFSHHIIIRDNNIGIVIAYFYEKINLYL